MKVRVMSKVSFDELMQEIGINDQNVEKLDGKFFISICNTSGKASQSWFHIDHKNVLRLFFDDIELASDFPDGVLFNDGHAKKILDLMKEMKFSDQVVVHCQAGVSRSAAVGSYIAKHFGILDDPNAFTHGKSFFPNHHVIRVLRKLGETP